MTKPIHHTYDSFDRNGVNILSISSVRVAGIGGLGLVAVAAVVATQFPLISAAMIAGAIGGGVAALAMIRRRRVGKVQTLRGPRREGDMI